PSFLAKPNPTHQDNEVALPIQRFSIKLIKLRREFSRCLRPSLSSKRPLRACAVLPARPQSSSLNEIVQTANSLDEVYQAFTSRASPTPGSESRHSLRRESAAEINRYTLGPMSKGPRPHLLRPSPTVRTPPPGLTPHDLLWSGPALDLAHTILSILTPHA
ncbi:hypothetical protein B0T14DRAFT_146679, partial [Immersiella caudata]